MKEKRITVDRIVKFLINDGYEAVEQRPKPDRDGMETIARIDTLHYNFRAAFVISRKLGVTKKTLDFVVINYVERSQGKEKGPAHAFLKMDYVGSLRRMTELPSPNTIIEFARLGASEATKEKLLAEVVRTGRYNEAATMAEMLERRLTKEEIAKLVEEYNRGGARSNSEETVLKKLAERSLDASDAEEVRVTIDRSRKEFDSHLD